MICAEKWGDPVPLCPTPTTPLSPYIIFGKYGAFPLYAVGSKDYPSSVGSGYDIIDNLLM